MPSLNGGVYVSLCYGRNNHDQPYIRAEDRTENRPHVPREYSFMKISTERHAQANTCSMSVNLKYLVDLPRDEYKIILHPAASSSLSQGTWGTVVCMKKP